MGLEVVIGARAGCAASGAAPTGRVVSCTGVAQPDGDYKMTITAKDASGKAVAVSTEIQGVVDSVDLTKSPPTLSVNNAEYTLDKIKRVVRQTSSLL